MGNKREEKNKSIKNNQLNNNKYEKGIPDIKKYTFVKELGKGGFGKVNLYKEKKNLHNFIAVKEYIGINELPKNLIKEKKILSEINHPYIIKYLFSCFDNNNFYIGMEYCKNRNLDYLINLTIKENSRIKEEYIWKVAYQTLKALAYLHLEKKLVHNDIKPSNILLTESFRY